MSDSTKPKIPDPRTELFEEALELVKKSESAPLVAPSSQEIEEAAIEIASMQDPLLPGHIPGFIEGAKWVLKRLKL